MRAAELRGGRAEPRGSSLTGERRHLTVLFCDLVNSTSLAAQLDPEEWREIVADYHRAVAQAIERFGGHVAQYLGDGVMAYFGYPEAHDNDAERAARAGLAILDAISKLNQPSTRSELSARIGIDSGTVVVGASAGKDADVFGDTPNIAARVQAAAQPGTVVITEANHRLVSGLFVVDQLGARTLKGIERPLQLYRVIQPSGVRGRLEAAAATRGLTPFVGREDELRLLMNRWERALDGEGQVALINGEPGIGKSRLVQRFHEQIAGTLHTWIETGAGAFFQNTPFYSVTELLHQFLGGNGGKPAEEQLGKLEPQLQLVGLNPAETIPLIAPLLNLPLSDKYPPLPLSPEQRRRRLLATLVEWVLGAARVQPLVVATEDLHWADASTLELIQLLVEQGATARLLLLYTARPEFHAEWPPRAHYMQITLSGLSARNVRAMLEEVAARKAMSDETIATVIERTGGVPLFVEELTRAVLESGGAGLTGRKIPATLHDSLMARLDRLGPAKEVIQVGAVIGSEFSYELLHTVHPVAEQDLQRALRSLTDAELLYVRGIAPDASYQFKHALIREAAYEALLKSRRKELHRRVALTIDEQFPALKEAHPELLARHWTEAGEAEPAITEWTTAGKAAEARNAFKEALESYQQALELLRTLPDTPGRIHQELTLQTALGLALVMTKGLGAPEVREAYDYARKLCERVGDTPQIFPVLYGLCNFYVQREEMRTAQELAEQTLNLAEKQNDPPRRIAAHRTLVSTSFWRGAFVEAHQHCERAVALYKSESYESLAPVYGLDPVVAALSIGAWALWYLGYPDQALKRGEDTLALARQIGHRYSLAGALDTVSWTYTYCREGKKSIELADAGIALSIAQEFPHWRAMGVWMRGLARTMMGEPGGVAELREGLDAYRATGAILDLRACGLADLARGLGCQGQFAKGLRMLDEALTCARETGLRHYEAEIHRFTGDLLLAGANETAQAEQCFQIAVAVARNQSAKSLELRATMSLARLLASQGRHDEARTALAEIYGWFTEGFDTPDLKDAKALLEELGA
jgi:class 3 adenylate cyclase/predicted ATPase